jgi:hypothetical protein
LIILDPDRSIWGLGSSIRALKPPLGHLGHRNSIVLTSCGVKSEIPLSEIIGYEGIQFGCEVGSNSMRGMQSTIRFMIKCTDRPSREGDFDFSPENMSYEPHGLQYY